MAGYSPAHPFGPPTVNGNQITVDTMLQQPTRVTAYVADMTQNRFFIDRAFRSAGGVTGGAVIHDVIDKNHLYPERRAEQIAPGTEFPNLTPERAEPRVAPVIKLGGKAWISREGVRRNELSSYQ